MECIRCNEEIETGDIYEDLCEQADVQGMESLTEDEQLCVEGKLCEECL